MRRRTVTCLTIMVSVIENRMTSLAMPRPMYLSEFIPLIGQALSVDCAPRSVELMLVEASPLRHGGQGQRPPFILIFTSTPAVLLMAGTYVMRGDGFGPASIYISPISAPGGSDAAHHYQAVFN